MLTEILLVLTTAANPGIKKDSHSYFFNQKLTTPYISKPEIKERFALREKDIWELFNFKEPVLDEYGKDPNKEGKEAPETKTEYNRRLGN
jgi:hypothetical protein